MEDLDVDGRIILKLTRNMGCFFPAWPISGHPTLLYRYVIFRVLGGLTVGEGSEKRIRCDNIVRKSKKNLTSTTKMLKMSPS